MNADIVKLVWDTDHDILALDAEIGAGFRPVALAQQYDDSRWVAIVYYDTPGTGAACVRPTIAEARTWIEETVLAAWPEWRDALADAPIREGEL